MMIPILGVMIFLLCGCGKENTIDYSDTYIFGQDSQETFMNYQNQCYFAADEKNYYYFDDKKYFLYTVDKITHHCQPMCNKSNCLHDKETDFDRMKECSAYLGVLSKNMLLYDNKIYYATETEYEDKDGNKYTAKEIYSINPDTLKRKLVFSDTGIAIWWFKIHRGYIYYAASPFYTKDDLNDVITKPGAVGADQSLYKLALGEDADKAIELIPYHEYGIQVNMNIINSRFYGNHLFLQIDRLLDEETQTRKQYLINYDLQTNDYKILNENDEFNITGLTSIMDSKLYFPDKSKIYECDFNGENIREIADFKNTQFGNYSSYHIVNNDGKNLVVAFGNDTTAESTLAFLTKSEDKFEMSFHKFENLAIDSNFLFTFCGCDEKAFIVRSEDKLYYIDKVTDKMEELYTFNE